MFDYTLSEVVHMMRLAGYRYQVMINDGTNYTAVFRHKNGTRRSGTGATSREAINACLTENIVHLGRVREQGQ
jgi:hypothetical protein